jgi:hypothetical protein
MNSIKESKPKNHEGPTANLHISRVLAALYACFSGLRTARTSTQYPLEKEEVGEWVEVLWRREWHELAVHEEAFESAFFAAGPKLKVGTLLIVNVQGFLPATRANITLDLIHQLPGYLHRHAHIGMRDG